jgi:hypothetical protein
LEHSAASSVANALQYPPPQSTLSNIYRWIRVRRPHSPPSSAADSHHPSSSPSLSRGSLRAVTLYTVSFSFLGGRGFRHVRVPSEHSVASSVANALQHPPTLSNICWWIRVQHPYLPPSSAADSHHPSPSPSHTRLTSRWDPLHRVF